MRTQLRTYICSVSLLLSSACALSGVDEEGETIEWDEDALVDGGVDQPAELDDVDAVEDELDDGLDDELDDAVTLARPRYQMPVRCGQRWRGETRRNHSPRLAIDLNKDPGDFGRAVLASAGGRVTVFADTGADSYGKWLEIGHGGGHRTRYAHLSKRTVRFNQRVRKGQKIGEVGATGGADGSHLHYEQLHGGSPIRIRFNGNEVHYFGERHYTSHNCD